MKKVLLLCCLTGFIYQGFSQVASYPFAQALDTFQLITGTVVDQQNEDDTYHANLPIGFTFLYNGNPTDKFGVCTNGFIILDSLSHPGTWFLNNNSKNQVCVALHDLKNSNTGGSIEYITVGSAPNRVLIVQWKDYGIFGLSYCHLNFQIRLYEGSNCVALYYGTNGVSGSGTNFHVGLIGDTASDFNFRTSLNDWTNSSGSLVYPGAGMHLGPLSTLPSGLVFAFGNCPATGLKFSYLTGKVYNDLNNNGSQDPGDNGLPNVILHESQLNTFISTDTGGNYALFYIDSSLTYSVSCTPYQYWSQSSLPSVYSVNPATQSGANLNFGIHATPNVHDVEISSVSSNLPWPGGNVHFHTTYHNRGTVTESDTLFFNKDGHYSFVTSNPTPSYNAGNTIYWLYTGLLPLEYRHITLTLQADTTVTQGDTLFSFWQINPFFTDTDQTNNRVDQAQVCLSSFDPNEKSVSPEGSITVNTMLNYTIRFQNTGTAPAQNIFIHDDLDAGLDAVTFEVKGYSHPMTWTMNGTGHLVFTFAGINLPDSNTNEPMSHGFIHYSVRPKSTLVSGTVIENTASIYFDFNAPVVTNTTQNIIGSGTSGIPQPEYVGSSLQVFPNPAGQEIKLVNASMQILQISIADMTGRLLSRTETGQTEIIRISTAHLSKGLYMIKAETRTGTVQVGSFVKD